MTPVGPRSQATRRGVSRAPGTASNDAAPTGQDGLIILNSKKWPLIVLEREPLGLMRLAAPQFVGVIGRGDAQRIMDWIERYLADTAPKGTE